MAVVCIALERRLKVQGGAAQGDTDHIDTPRPASYTDAVDLACLTDFQADQSIRDRMRSLSAVQNVLRHRHASRRVLSPSASPAQRAGYDVAGIQGPTAILASRGLDARYAQRASAAQRRVGDSTRAHLHPLPLRCASGTSCVPDRPLWGSAV